MITDNDSDDDDDDDDACMHVCATCGHISLRNEHFDPIGLPG